LSDASNVYKKVSLENSYSLIVCFQCNSFGDLTNLPNRGFDPAKAVTVLHAMELAAMPVACLQYGNRYVKYWELRDCKIPPWVLPHSCPEWVHSPSVHIYPIAAHRNTDGFQTKTRSSVLFLSFVVRYAHFQIRSFPAS